MSADVPVTVAAVRAVARDVLALELRHANGQPLPGATMPSWAHAARKAFDLKAEPLSVSKRLIVTPSLP